MAYSQGGLIDAADYNGFIGTSPSSTANKLNTVWAVGNGNAGYGQTAIAQVSSAGLVTATQWATMINNLNSARTHQSGSGSGISAVTSGSTVNYLSTLSTNITTAYTNRSTFNAQGTTTTGSVFSPNFTAVNQLAASTFNITRTATFASADQARYFFNAGGQLNFVVTSTTNGDSTSRSSDLVTLMSTNFVSKPAFRSASASAHTGTGGTVNTDSTTIGYFNLTTSYQTLTKITSATSGYTGDYVELDVKSNGVQGSNADVGTVITFYVTIYSAARTGTAFNDTINITPNHRIDIVYPETTNLTNSWGTVTIA